LVVFLSLDDWFLTSLRLSLPALMHLSGHMRNARSCCAALRRAASHAGICTDDVQLLCKERARRTLNGTQPAIEGSALVLARADR
jgi:hypothetical protein